MFNPFIDITNKISVTSNNEKKKKKTCIFQLCTLGLRQDIGHLVT